MKVTSPSQILADLTSPLGRSPRVLLVRPSQKFYNAKFPRGPRVGLPNGIISIGSVLKRKGCEVQIFDALVEGAFPKDAKKDSVSLYGASWSKLKETALNFQPDVIGITNIFRETMEESMEAARQIKSVLPDKLVIVGGPNATSHCDIIVEQCHEVDFVGTNDGEDTTLEVVEFAIGLRTKHEIKNIVYVQNGEIKRTEQRHLPLSLDPLGSSDYDLVDLEKYFELEQKGVMARGRFHHDGGERSVSIMTSRGCPYKCVFCSIHIHAGYQYRIYSPEMVVDQIERLVRDFRVKHIHFEDDNLTLDRDRFIAIMDGILERGLKFTWDTPNGVFANTLTEKMMVKMIETGCSYLIVAVESGDQWVLDNVVKKIPMKIEDALNAFEIGKRIGLDMQAFYIIGFPGESLTQIYRTVDFALNALRKYDVIPHLATARADKGTELYDVALEQGYLVENMEIDNPQGVHIDRFVRHLVSTDEFTPELLNEINTAYHKKFIREIVFKVLLQMLRNPITALRHLKIFIESYLRMNLNIREAIYLLFFTRLFYPNASRREKTLFKGCGPDHETGGAPKGPGVLPSHENVAVTDTNSKTRVRLLVKNLLLSPLKLLSYIASFYASLLENISVGLGDYWLECESAKNRLKKQTITYFKNSKIEKLTLFTPNWTCRFRANTFSTKEPETIEWIDESESDGVFFDIGANVGLYSLYYAATKKGKVYAFEPSVFNLSLLAKNIYENRLHNQIKIITNPLTQQNQFADFGLSTIEEGGAMSAFGVDYDHNGKPINKKLIYQTLGLSLDFLITNNIITERPSLIKIDVDGLEHLVLAGAIETLKHPTCRSVSIETNDNCLEQANSISKILLKCGFSLKEKRQAEMFAGSKFQGIYNNIWRKKVFDSRGQLKKVVKSTRKFHSTHQVKY